MISSKLPVCRLLDDHFDDLFNGLQEALSIYEEEVASNELEKHIDISSKDSIGSYAEIRNISKPRIFLSEEFLQLLWCNSFSFLSMFDHGYKQPMLNGCYQGELEDNAETRNARRVFGYGMSSINGQNNVEDVDLIYSLQAKIYEDEYVSKSSKVFACAMAFVILHEIIHLRFKHLDCDGGKEDEYVADKMALETLLQVDIKLRRTAIIGVVVAISSLCLLPDGMSGSDTHPDTDDRIDRMLCHMQISSEDDCYCLTSIFYLLWLGWKGCDTSLRSEYQCCKELYDEVRGYVSLHK
ncbi:MAG: phage exclusion protein Lit family protein [Desulfovibrio sp.]